MLRSPVAFRRIPERLNLIRTPRNTYTSQIHISIFLNGINPKIPNRIHIVIISSIVVPRFRVPFPNAVKEDYGVGQVFVIIDDVCKIYE